MINLDCLTFDILQVYSSSSLFSKLIWTPLNQGLVWTDLYSCCFKPLYTSWGPAAIADDCTNKLNSCKAVFLKSASHFMIDILCVFWTICTLFYIKWNSAKSIYLCVEGNEHLQRRIHVILKSVSKLDEMNLLRNLFHQLTTKRTLWQLAGVWISRRQA